MSERSTYLYRACFVFCGGHFEFLIRARGLLVQGLEPKLRKSLGACSEICDAPRICESQTSKISVPDPALADCAQFTAGAY